MSIPRFDFQTLQDIPSRLNHRDTPRLTITEKGLISINGALRSRVGERRAFRAKISPDGRYMALCTREEPNLQFGLRSGRTYHAALCRLVEEMGFTLPVVYTMEWDEEHSAWIGGCEEIAPPPALSALREEKTARRRKAAGRQA